MAMIIEEIVVTDYTKMTSILKKILKETDGKYVVDIFALKKCIAEVKALKKIYIFSEFKCKYLYLKENLQKLKKMETLFFKGFDTYIPLDYKQRRDKVALMKIEDFPCELLLQYKKSIPYIKSYFIYQKSTEEKVLLGDMVLYGMPSEDNYYCVIGSYSKSSKDYLSKSFRKLMRKSFWQLKIKQLLDTEIFFCLVNVFWIVMILLSITLIVTQ